MPSVNGYVAFFDVSVSLSNNDDDDDDHDDGEEEEEKEEEEYDDDDERGERCSSSFSSSSLFFFTVSLLLDTFTVCHSMCALLSYSLIFFLVLDERSRIIYCVLYFHEHVCSLLQFSSQTPTNDFFFTKKIVKLFCQKSSQGV